MQIPICAPRKVFFNKIGEWLHGVQFVEISLFHITNMILFVLKKEGKKLLPKTIIDFKHSNTFLKNRLIQILDFKAF